MDVRLLHRLLYQRYNCHERAVVFHVNSMSCAVLHLYFLEKNFWNSVVATFVQAPLCLKSLTYSFFVSVLYNVL